MDPGDPNLGNMYERSLEEIRDQGIRLLPQSLPEAIDEFAGDEVIQAALGPIARDFIDVKRQEWENYHRQVTSWEVERYLTCL